LGTAAFEIAYITVQAALGQASHLNVGDPFHAAMYSLMGIGAVTLSAASLVLGIVLARAGAPWLPRPYRLSVALGLILTFVLGAGIGAVLSSMGSHWIGGTPSDVAGVPLFGCRAPAATCAPRISSACTRCTPCRLPAR